MSIDLTEEQRLALKQDGGPLRVRDPETDISYVLVPSEVYERVKVLFAEEEDDQFLRAMYSHVMEVFGREGWNDPAMDIYGDLDPRRKT